MAGDNVTTLNALMAEVFVPMVERTFDIEKTLLMRFKKITGEEVNQRGGRIPVETLRQGSFVGGTESQEMPTAVAGEDKYWVPSLKAAYSTGQFSGWAHWQTNALTVEGQANALNIGGMISEKVASHVNDFSFVLDRHCYRDGKGKMADAITAITTGASGTATVLPSTANFPVDEIPIGAIVNFYNSSGTAHVTGAATSTVTAVNPTTGVVTFDSVPTNAVVGDFIVHVGSWDLLPDGLVGMVQSSSVTKAGLDVTNYANLKSPTLDASAAFDIKFVNRMQTRSRKYGGIKRPRNDYNIITHPKQVDSYRNAGYALNTMIADSNRQEDTLDLGYSSVKISGMDIYEANNCGERDLFGLRMDSFRRYSLFEPNLLPIWDGQSQYLGPQPGTNAPKHVYQYFLAFYGNLLCVNPAANFRVFNLDKTSLG